MMSSCMKLPTPGSVWIVHLWRNDGRSPSLRPMPCLVLTVSAQDDRSDPDGNDVRRCRLLMPSGSVDGVLSSMFDFSRGRLA